MLILARVSVCRRESRLGRSVFVQVRPAAEALPADVLLAESFLNPSAPAAGRGACADYVLRGRDSRLDASACALNGCLTAGDFPNAEEDRAALADRFARASWKRSSRATPRYSKRSPLPTWWCSRRMPSSSTGRDASVELMRQFFEQERAAYRVRQHPDPGGRRQGFRSWHVLPDRDAEGRRRAHGGQGKILVVLRAYRSTETGSRRA